ncbi:MAG: hypothetical protein GWP10_06980 [Nitrospiraceae bacterium]|nr:hypothetical protein [Nitrospiraceae bacterium]
MMKTDLNFKPEAFNDICDLLKHEIADELRNDPAISHIEITREGCVVDIATMTFFIHRALERIVEKKSNLLLYGRDQNPSFVLREWYEKEDEIEERTCEQLKGHIRPQPTHPYGEPNKLLAKIAGVAQDWGDDKLSHEAAMARVETIIRQNHRLPSQEAFPPETEDCVVEQSA